MTCRCVGAACGPNSGCAAANACRTCSATPGSRCRFGPPMRLLQHERSPDDIRVHRLGPLVVEQHGQIPPPTRSGVRPGPFDRRLPDPADLLPLLVRVAHQVQMRRQVVERVADHGEFPVDGPQVTAEIDDEVRPVQITVDEHEGPGRQPPRPGLQPFQGGVTHTQPVEQRVVRGAVLPVDPLLGERDQADQETRTVAFLGPVLGPARSARCRSRPS